MASPNEQEQRDLNPNRVEEERHARQEAEYRLRERGHWAASVRLNDPTTPIVELIGKGIEAAARDDPSIELIRDPTAGLPTANSALWNMLGSLEVWKRNDLQQLVIVLDQF